MARRTMTFEEAMTPAPASADTQTVGDPAPQSKRVMSFEEAMGIATSQPDVSTGTAPQPRPRQVLSFEGAMGLSPKQTELSTGQQMLETVGTIGGLISNEPTVQPPASSLPPPVATQANAPRMPVLRTTNAAKRTQILNGPQLIADRTTKGLIDHGQELIRQPKVARENVERVQNRKLKEVQDFDERLQTTAIERFYGVDLTPVRIEVPTGLSDAEFFTRYMAARPDMDLQTGNAALMRYKEGYTKFDVPNDQALRTIRQSPPTTRADFDRYLKQVQAEAGISEMPRDRSGKIMLSKPTGAPAEPQSPEVNPNPLTDTVHAIAQPLSEGDIGGTLRAIPEQGVKNAADVTSEATKGLFRGVWQQVMPGALETVAATSQSDFDDPYGGKYNLQGLAEYMRQVGGQYPSAIKNPDITSDPSLLINPLFYAKTVGEQTPIMAAMVAGGAAGGVPAAMATGFTAEAGNYIAQTRAELIQQGIDPEKANQIATQEGMAYGVVAAALEYAPLAKWIEGKEIVGQGFKSVLVGRARQAVAEGSTEALQSLSEDLVRMTGEGDSAELGDILKKALNEAVAGAVMGGAMGQPTRSDSSGVREAIAADAVEAPAPDAMIQPAVADVASRNTAVAEPAVAQEQPAAAPPQPADIDTQTLAVAAMQPDNVSDDGTTSTFTGPTAEQRATAYAQTLRGEDAVSNVSVTPEANGTWVVALEDQASDTAAVKRTMTFEEARGEQVKSEQPSGPTQAQIVGTEAVRPQDKTAVPAQAEGEAKTEAPVRGAEGVARVRGEGLESDAGRVDAGGTQAVEQGKTVRIPREFTIGSLERKLGNKAKAVPSALEAANTRVASEIESGNISLPEGVFGVTPDDIAGLLPTQKARIHSVIPVHEDYGSVRDIVGDKVYQNVIDEILGGDTGRVNRYIASLGQSSDPQDVFDAYVLKLAKDAKQVQGGRVNQSTVRADDLIEGDKFTIHGEEFTVRIDEDGEAILKDGITVPAPDKIPVDDGSLQRAEIEGDDPFGASDLIAPGRVPGQQGSLLGARSMGGVTGSQSELFGGNAPATEQRTESDEDAKIRRKFDQTATPSMFDLMAGTRDDAPAKARRKTSTGQDAFGPNNQRPMAGVAKAEVAIPQVIKHLEAMTGTPIRSKHGNFAKSQSLGWWDRRNNRIRVKITNSMTTIAHEVGHSIHDRWLSGRTKFDQVTKDELVRMGKDLYGDRKPNGGYLREGVAEYMRFRLLRADRQGNAVDVATHAPNFHRWFNEEFLAKSSDRDANMAEAERLYKLWDDQGALARVDAQIHRIARGPLANLRGAFEKLSWTGFKTLWNDAAPLEAAERRLRKERGSTADVFEAVRRGELDPIHSPSFMRAALKMSAPAMARSFIEQAATNLAGDRVGASLAEILRPIKRSGKLQEWTIYAYARRALDLHERGINPGISKADATYVVDTLKSPEFDQAIVGITRWSNSLIEYMVDAGGLSAEAADTIRQMNPVYIPLQRHFDTDFMGNTSGLGGSKGVVNQSQAVKRIKGSFRQIIDPIESLAQMAENIISRANKIRVARAIPELIHDNPGAAWFAQKIDPGDTVQEIRLEEIARQLEEIGVDLGEADLDQILTVFQNAGQRNFGKDNIVGIWRDGNQEFYELDKDVYRVLTDMDKDYIPQAMRVIFAPATRMMRLGATGLNAGFSLLTNPVRDAVSLPIYSRYGVKTPLGSVVGFWDEMRKTPEAQKWIAMGGPMATIMGQDRIVARRAVDEGLASTLTEKTVRTFKHPIDAMRAMFGLPENAPRIAEFKKALAASEKKWGKGSESAAIEALMASKDVTVNFTRMGLATGPLNALYPFFNAQVQSVDKFIRMFGGSPGKASLQATVKAMTWITLPSVLLWLMNRDEEWYNELQDWEWQGYWHFSPDGGKTIFRLPKPFELGYVFGTIPEASLREMYGKDKDATLKAIEQTGMSFLPFKTPWDAVPQVAKPGAEAYMNRSSFPEPRDIDSRGDMNKLPEDRYNDYTTEMSKQIGKFLGISPKRIDHVIRGYSGGLATNIARAVEGVTGTKESDGDTQLADMPVVGRAVRRNAVGRAASVDDLYELREQLSQKKGSNKLEHGELSRLRRVERAIKQVQSIRDRHEAGRIEDDAAQKQIVQVARQALK